MADTNTARSTRKRPAPKARATASARTRRKPAPRKPSKTKTRTETPTTRPVGRLEAAARDIALAQLGMAAHLLEAVATRALLARAEAPKQWDACVKRGEQVQRDIGQAGDGLIRQITARVGKFEPRSAVGESFATARSLYSMISRRRAPA